MNGVTPPTRRWYIRPGKAFASHQSVSHARGEYVRRQEPEVHSNIVPPPAPNCKPGKSKPCGHTCIALNKVCHVS